MPSVKNKLTLIGLIAVLATVLVAELFRFQGRLLLDLLAPAVAFSALALNIKKYKAPPWILPGLLFLGIGFASLLLNSVEGQNFAQNALYILRYLSLFLLGALAWNLPKKEQKILWTALLCLTSLLAIAGFIQLKLVPDFTAYEVLGWDPHQNRLLSTWFDPNFIGGFFAFMLTLMAGQALNKPKLLKGPLSLAILVSAIALTLTYSRSSWLAALIGLTLLALFKNKKLLLAFIPLALLALLIPSIQDRALSLVQSALALFSDNYTLPDASARLRLESWSEGWQLFLQKPLLGHGYNAYKDAAVTLGTQIDPGSHAATGSDSSLLTVLATTGILGALAFLSMHFKLIQLAWHQRSHALPSAFLAALAGLAVHSIFVNSLLFPIFLAPFWIATALALKPNLWHN